MNFESAEERLSAMVYTALYLPSLIGAIKEGLEDLGLEIVRRCSFVDENRNSCLAWEFRIGKGPRYFLIIKKTYEDFIAVDRRADPVRVDSRLSDSTFAKAKISDLVEKRLKFLEVLLESIDLPVWGETATLIGGDIEVMRVIT